MSVESVVMLNIFWNLWYFFIRFFDNLSINTFYPFITSLLYKSIHFFKMTPNFWIVVFIVIQNVYFEEEKKNAVLFNFLFIKESWKFDNFYQS